VFLLVLLLVGGSPVRRRRIALDAQLRQTATMLPPEACPVVPVYQIACEQLEQAVFDGVPGKASRADDDAECQLRAGQLLAG
jgi:hypothetical protein